MDVSEALNVVRTAIGPIGFVIAIVSLAIALDRVRAAKKASKLEGEMTTLLALLIVVVGRKVAAPGLVEKLTEEILNRARQLTADDRSFGDLLDSIIGKLPQEASG